MTTADPPVTKTLYSRRTNVKRQLQTACACLKIQEEFYNQMLKNWENLKLVRELLSTYVKRLDEELRFDAIHLARDIKDSVEYFQELKILTSEEAKELNNKVDEITKAIQERKEFGKEDCDKFKNVVDKFDTSLQKAKERGELTKEQVSKAKEVVGNLQGKLNVLVENATHRDECVKDLTKLDKGEVVDVKKHLQIRLNESHKEKDKIEKAVVAEKISPNENKESKKEVVNFKSEIAKQRAEMKKQERERERERMKAKQTGQDASKDPEGYIDLSV